MTDQQIERTVQEPVMQVQLVLGWFERLRVRTAMEWEESMMINIMLLDSQRAKMLPKKMEPI